MRRIFQRLAKGTDFKQLLDMVSPAFFDVMPARQLVGQAREIAANYKDVVAYGEALQRRSDLLAASDLPIAIGAVEGTPSADADAQGRHLLSLYFHQFLAGGPGLLDFRPSRFGIRGGRLIWDPAPVFVQWDDTFVQGMRGLYGGFYEGDDARFRHALDSLGLLAAESVFRRQFGAGDQRAVTFATKEFVSTFHEAFVLCRDNGDTLHPNFMPMGMALAMLYDHLETLDAGPLDVRAAYFDAATHRAAA